MLRVDREIKNYTLYISDYIITIKVRSFYKRWFAASKLEHIKRFV